MEYNKDTPLSQRANYDPYLQGPVEPPVKSKKPSFSEKLKSILKKNSNEPASTVTIKTGKTKPQDAGAATSVPASTPFPLRVERAVSQGAPPSPPKTTPSPPKTSHQERHFTFHLSPKTVSSQLQPPSPPLASTPPPVASTPPPPAPRKREVSFQLPTPNAATEPEPSPAPIPPTTFKLSKLIAKDIMEDFMKPDELEKAQLEANRTGNRINLKTKSREPKNFISTALVELMNEKPGEPISAEDIRAKLIEHAEANYKPIDGTAKDMLTEETIKHMRKEVKNMDKLRKGKPANFQFTPKEEAALYSYSDYDQTKLLRCLKLYESRSKEPVPEGQEAPLQEWQKCPITRFRIGDHKMDFTNLKKKIANLDLDTPAIQAAIAQWNHERSNFGG